jgi:hypothetical protein
MKRSVAMGGKMGKKSHTKAQRHKEEGEEE